MTIEDPIEFLHLHKNCIVNQREIGQRRAELRAGLKAALRQDPDVILVGEMRDLETISTALTAAETGHLVFATLHTQDTAQTIDRIIDVFPPLPAAAGARAALGGASGHRDPAAAADRRRLGPRVCCCEVLTLTPGGPEPDPRGQDAPDLLGAPDLRGQGHAVDGRRAGAAGAHRARSLVSWPSPASSSPDELRRLMGVRRGGDRPHEHLRLQGRRPLGHPRPRAGRGGVEAGGHRSAARARADRPRHRRGEERPHVRRPVRPLPAHQGLRPDGHDPSARHHGELRHVAAARVLRARGGDREQEAGRRSWATSGATSRPALSLSDGLRKHPDMFNDLYVAMAETGEAAGMLEETLERVADQLEKSGVAEAPDPGRDGLPDPADRLSRWSSCSPWWRS